ncbi:alpha/beta hydrolase [Algoriphagus hitonicola]|uniref:Prolyl oligopeptidase family protein n=1 Tax=Algoriphagus hitonicola TaxID=435880 RepID=A0A1I2S122_9BACT|nr:alpha/beta hydrolase [Algoriphagus hitonicola]SFG46023.1 Prolyl oligopeptidase family protein [Algoriphagus hitonicola]
MKSTNRFFYLLPVYVFTLLFLFSCNRGEEIDPNAPLPALELFDQTYGQDPRQSFDVYLPEGRTRENTPLLIYIHGGAWIDGSKDEFLQFKPWMEQSFPDYAFVAINYRLYDFNTEANSFPTQENDVILAIEQILSELDEWNISDQVILAGGSAGGHLALLHGYKHQPIGNIQGIIAFFPPTNLSTLYDFNFLTESGLREILEGTPETNPELYQSSSPVSYVDENTIPTIFFHGTVDNVVPISQSEELEEKLIQFDVAHRFITVPGQGHGFDPDTYVNLIEEAAQFIRENP